jgi:hypothetical protein
MRTQKKNKKKIKSIKCCTPLHSLFHLTIFENYPPLEFYKVPNYHATSPPFLMRFPPKFGTFGFHSRKPLVYEAEQFTLGNYKTFPTNQSKLNQGRNTEHLNVHLPKKKNNTID